MWMSVIGWFALSVIAGNWIFDFILKLGATLNPRRHLVKALVTLPTSDDFRSPRQDLN